MSHICHSLYYLRSSSSHHIAALSTRFVRTSDRTNSQHIVYIFAITFWNMLHMSEILVGFNSDLTFERHMYLKLISILLLYFMLDSRREIARSLIWAQRIHWFLFEMTIVIAWQMGLLHHTDITRRPVRSSHSRPETIPADYTMVQFRLSCREEGSAVSRANLPSHQASRGPCKLDGPASILPQILPTDTVGLMVDAHHE